MADLSPAQINDLRSAAEVAWGDDTRNEQFVGHPSPCQGQLTPAERGTWAPEYVPYSYCHCGCGLKTTIATRTRNGNTKGQPCTWLPGHSQRTFPPNLKYEVTDGGFISPCWIWTGAFRRSRYGGYSSRWPYAHIVSYRWYRGAIPEGYELDHLCRQTLCINPTHLEPVPHGENVRRGNSTKLTWEDVRFIRASDLTWQRLADLFDVSKSNIGWIKQNKTWIENGS